MTGGFSPPLRRRRSRPCVWLASVLFATASGVSGLQLQAPPRKLSTVQHGQAGGSQVSTLEFVLSTPATTPTKPTGGDFTQWKIVDPSAPIPRNVHPRDIAAHLPDRSHQDGIARCVALLSALRIPAAQQLSARNIAFRIAEASADYAATLASLVYQALRDDHITVDEVEFEFGAEVAQLSANLAKLVQLEDESHRQLFNDPKRTRLSAFQASNLREMLLSTTNDWRSLMIMLVHRVHETAASMDTASPSCVSARARSRETHLAAREALDVYAPLAHRLGMSELKNMFEDCGFRLLYPLQHRLLTGCLDRRAETYSALLDGQNRALKQLMQEDELLIHTTARVEVQGRKKSPYSTWRKLLKMNSRRPIDFVRDPVAATDSVLDAVALRVVVEPRADAEAEITGEQLCYHVQQLIHQRWPALPGRDKDYIRQPKANGYSALHSTVHMRHHGRDWPFEVQVKTRAMHDEAEWGSAAHHRHAESTWEWLLNKGGQQEHHSATAGLAQALLARRSRQDTAQAPAPKPSEPSSDDLGLQPVSSALEYAEWWHNELQRNHVYVLGHDAQVWKLDRGVQIGGLGHDLLVNGHPVPLHYELRNGDVVGVV